MVLRTPRSRLVLGAAVALLLVVALVSLIVVRDGDGDGQLAASAFEPPTTASSVVTTPPTVVTTLPAPTTTATSVTAPPTTSPSPPPTTRPVTTAPAGEQLTTTAGGHGPVQAALAEARQRWQVARPAQGYVWSYENECRCSPRKVEVTVDGAGSVTAVRELDGAPSSRPPEDGTSVDGALAQVQAAIDANAARISVRFDPVRGLPSSYLIDRSTMLADEERGLSLLSFTPRS